ncbi:MAG: methylenetetrahydrofolate dehydrogenase (NADP+) / methenyltetrahydrofolate cyclohydrolase [Chloroflexi bacterium]|nr:MAG: methylenetetrahydrofolate dehydrogenase (NADP+) / methenyltetrahydrofolate cyclohydrolase [Chloroflexota bacterium]
MAASIINGKGIAQEIRSEVKAEIEILKESRGLTPGLAVVLIGNDPASAIYVKNKEVACEEVGISTRTFHLPTDVSEEQVVELITSLNKSGLYHGILTQLPFPPHINDSNVIDHLDPAKDVDGLHPYNFGLLAAGTPRFIAATPYGVQQMLIRTGNDPAGKHVVVCGRSNIVGKPLSMLFSQKQAGSNATVTLCHSNTKDLGYFTKQADILVVAIGSPEVINADMVKEGAVVIDVGINRIDDDNRKRGYRLVGDVAFSDVSEVASAITPVPGGVGPMTIAMLLVNTVAAAKSSID